MSIINRPSAGIAPVCFLYFLIIFLLFPSSRPVQSIALSSLCGQFGHSCFGGNWGKRELTTSSSSPGFISSDLDTNNGRTAISNLLDDSSMNNLLEQLRLNLFRQRLRQLYELE